MVGGGGAKIFLINQRAKLHSFQNFKMQRGPLKDPSCTHPNSALTSRQRPLSSPTVFGHKTHSQFIIYPSRQLHFGYFIPKTLEISEPIWIISSPRINLNYFIPTLIRSNHNRRNETTSFKAENPRAEEEEEEEVVTCSMVEKLSGMKEYLLGLEAVEAAEEAWEAPPFSFSDDMDLAVVGYRAATSALLRSTTELLLSPLILKLPLMLLTLLLFPRRLRNPKKLPISSSLLMAMEGERRLKSK